MKSRGAVLVSFVVGLSICNASESKLDGSDTKKKGLQAKEEGASLKSIEHKNFVVDKSHARIGFKVAHLVISKVHGSFNDFDATLHLHGNELSKASATIKVASIDTGNKDRDDHLREAGFFDSAQYPNITFHGKSIKKINGKSIMVGDLTIKGRKKEIELEYTLKGPVKDPFGGAVKVGLEATGKINRKNFGVEWNKVLESGGVVIGEEVDLLIDLEAVQKYAD